MSQIPTDDEVTNTDTAIDFFGDKVKKSNEEDLELEYLPALVRRLP